MSKLEDDLSRYFTALALPYLLAIRDAVSDELRPPLEVMVAWLEDGSPAPTPAEVIEASNQAMEDWIARC